MATGTLDLTAIPSVVVQRVATRDPDDGLALIPELLSMTWSYTDGTALDLAIPATADNPIIVRSCTIVISTALAGGTPSLDVGDGTTADLFIDTTAVAETVLGTVVSGTVGKLYVANGVVRLTLNASLSAGAGVLLVEVVRL